MGSIGMALLAQGVRGSIPYLPTMVPPLEG